MDRRALAAAGVVVAVLLPACDAGSRESVGPDAPSSAAAGPTLATQPTGSEGCIDGTVVEYGGNQGFISAGPLAVNSEYWR